MSCIKEKKYKHILNLTGGSIEERERLAGDLAERWNARGLRVLIVCSESKESYDQRGLSSLPSGIDSFLVYQWMESSSAALCTTVPFQVMFNYDLVLHIPFNNNENEDLDILVIPSGQTEPIFTWQAGGNVAQLAEHVVNWLSALVLDQTVWGAVLIGGKSSRMGQPKQMLRDHRGVTWVERIVGQLTTVVDRVILLGKGEVPDNLQHLDRIPDCPGIQGPMAGIVAAMRWQPEVSWLVAACDMPAIHNEALDWLLGSRIPGIWGTVPRHSQSGRLEPLLAYYDHRSRALFEGIMSRGEMKTRSICTSSKIITPEIPDHLTGSWMNCNTPDDLIDLEKNSYHPT